MSQQRCFSIVGDSNVGRNMTSLNRRASPLMEECQVLSCKRFSVLADTLRSVRTASNSCIVACLTNFLTDLSSRGSASASTRVEPILTEIRDVLASFSTANPDVMVFVSPPMYRQQPEWYRNGLSEVVLQFSKTMSPLRSPVFHLLPSFSDQDLESDGVHLTPYAGLKFVVHLFDSSLDLIKSCSATIPVAVAQVKENARVLEDRVVVLEKGQRHLRQELQMKTAIDNELADFEENLRNECYFVISGLEPVPSDLYGREWQNHAKKLVQSKIRLVIGRESKIVVVSGLRRDDNPIYLVKLESTDDSKRIRDKFGSSFKAGGEPLPPGLSGLSIRIRLTHATRVRLAIMQVLAANYKTSNPGSRTQVVNFAPRPLLRLTPPQDAADTRVMSFTFIEAVTRLPIKFSKKDLAGIMKVVGGKFKGQLRSLFVVISDDDRSSGRQRRESATSSSSGSGSGSDEETERGPPGDRRSGSGGSGSRMETSVPEQDSNPTTLVRDKVSSKAPRGHKRGHSSPNRSGRANKSRH